MFKISFYTLILCGLFSNWGNGQINPNTIDIIRDSYGVPHIYAQTDAALAYGLAWAHAEDDFKTIQLGYLAGNALLSKHLKNKGLPADFITQFIGSEELIEKDYENKISPAYKKVVEGYAAGMNQFALKHPEQVLVADLFPITPKKMLRYAQLQLFISSQGDRWVQKIINNEVEHKLAVETEPKGSNTFGFNSAKTTNGNTFLAINTHQPLDGPVSWYEAHLNSEEGTNILGALFAGSPNILIGINEYLAWTHTVNQPDKTDVFALEMHPKKKLHYRIDDQYYPLEVKKAQLQVSILGIPLKIKKKYYQSLYGPTLKNKSGYFAVNTPSLHEIRALEQWWRMNKATSFSSFYSALKMKALPGYNIGYADRNDTIFYISNGLIPKRQPGYDWANVVPGNTQKTLWQETYDIEELPQVLQPKSGYFYNANHSPFLSSEGEDNPDPALFSQNMGFEDYDNNRSTRLKQLIDSIEKVSYADFKRIKYDHSYPKPYRFSWMNIDILDQLDATQYPDISSLILRLQNWDRKAAASSLGAGTFAALYQQLKPIYAKLTEPKIITETLMVQALRSTREHFLRHFSTLEVSLGMFQKLVRGSKELPIFGLPDVITAMAAVPHQNGTTKVVSGESYIALVEFDKGTPKIETVISYGSSDHPDSPHFDDQMGLYAAFKTKPMTLNKEEVYSQAKRIYHPQ